MNILVFVAGVMDPKWPVVPEGAGLPVRDASRLVMSPFDEAALEIGLKIRDALPAATVRALVAGGAEAEKLARSIAAFNLSDVATFAAGPLWDQDAIARQMAGVVEHADLVLIGREFGDCDDGLVAPMLAGLLGIPFFGRVQAAAVTDTVTLIRETTACEERVKVDRSMLASVTNDRRARLRKPLMKNVMSARHAPIGRRAVADAGRSYLALREASALAGAREPVSCRLMPGTSEDQAAFLASLLIEECR